MSTIKPELLGGFRDILPAEAISQKQIIDKIKGVYERFGFVPLDTPSMEKLQILTGGDADFNKSIFTAKIVRGAEDKNLADEDLADDYALRFDLTLPLARIVAAYPDLPRPFKRYQLGKVWRGEKPQAGRFREFYQFDFDIIGSNSILADTEIIMIINEVMKALELDKFIIKINTRKVLNGLTEVIGLQAKAKEVFRIIDKLDKIGADGVKKELMRQPDNAYDESALALSAELAQKVIDFISIKSSNWREVIAQLENLFQNKTVEGEKGIKELKTIAELLEEAGLSQTNWSLDLSVARGLDYYNGPVFETYLNDLPQLGSVLSGGRFDGLADRFIVGSKIPGVGASVGLDRLIVGLKQLGLLKEQKTTTQILVSIFDPALERQSLKISTDLRQAGFNTELYLGDDRTLKSQISYAAKMEIPLVIVLGPDEVAQNKVVIKDMIKREQLTVTTDELITKVKEIIKP